VIPLPGGLPMIAPGVPEAGLVVPVAGLVVPVAGLVVPVAVPEETPEGEETAPPTAWGDVGPV
jgi:hypothetical protein